MSNSVTPWSAAYQAPPSMGFSREEYWSGVPLPSLGPEPRAAETKGQVLRSLRGMMGIGAERFT